MGIGTYVGLFDEVSHQPEIEERQRSLFLSRNLNQGGLSEVSLEHNTVSRKFHAKDMGSPTIANDVGGTRLGEQPPYFIYMSVFIAHFLSLPKENLAILRNLYVEYGLTGQQISEITEGQWSRPSVIGTLKKLGIKRPKLSSTTKYGEKNAGCKRVPHLGELRVIQRVCQMREGGLLFHQIAKTLNEGGVPSRLGDSWGAGMVEKIYRRGVVVEGVLKKSEKKIMSVSSVGEALV